MKASDYIVEYLIGKGITDVFGYPGGMVTHLMDSFCKYDGKISAHVSYHEQGAAFAACGYAQTSGKPGVAYATSGPGATNLVTGICNAFFDSIPTVFITGQVNASESKGKLSVRQRGFQETDIVSIVRPVTKYAKYIENIGMLPACLDEAFESACTGRMGPALLDIPMNIFKEEIASGALKNLTKTSHKDKNQTESIKKILSEALKSSRKPCVLIGNGVKIAGCEEKLRACIDRAGIPSVSSMLAFDALKSSPNFYGFIGAYGTRTGNFIAAKSDLIISVGARMDIRQVGVRRDQFAPEAKIIRVDADEGELDYQVHQDEVHIHADVNSFCAALEEIDPNADYSSWSMICREIKSLLQYKDSNTANDLIRQISSAVPENTVITTDVGQNQVWIAQSFQVKEGQKVLFSGGHGAMGFSLPAAIGAFYGAAKDDVLCITGDGGMQMNIQELQFIARERLPIKIIVLNNNSLGMIRHFQEMYFEGNYFQTKPEGGYTAPNFSKIGNAYGIHSTQIRAGEEIGDLFASDQPELLEIIIDGDTYVTPKLEFGKPNQDQEPLIERELYDYIMGLEPTR